MVISSANVSFEPKSSSCHHEEKVEQKITSFSTMTGPVDLNTYNVFVFMGGESFQIIIEKSEACYVS